MVVVLHQEIISVYIKKKLFDFFEKKIVEEKCKGEMLSCIYWENLLKVGKL